MSVTNIFGGSLDALTKGAEEAIKKALEQTFGLSLATTFIEQVLVSIAAALAVSAILSSPFVWRWLSLRWSAARIRKASGNTFVIVRCPIIDGTEIGNSIAARIEEHFLGFAGWQDKQDQTSGEQRAFEIMWLPLALSGDQEGTAGYDRAVAKAKYWLDRTNGDILIWGKHVRRGSVGVIRLIGRDRKKGVIVTRTIDFETKAHEFDEALAAAIAYEAARITQVTLSDPMNASLSGLRRTVEKLKSLAVFNAPALSKDWSNKLATEYRRLNIEIFRRSTYTIDSDELEREARAHLRTAKANSNDRVIAESALGLAILIRKRAWIDAKLSELAEAVTLIEQAISVLRDDDASILFAEAALERLLLRRLEIGLDLLTKDSRSLDEAEADVRKSGNNRLLNRFLAFKCLSLNESEFRKLFGYGDLGGDHAVRLLHRMANYLDNSELIDFCSKLSDVLSTIGNYKLDGGAWRASVSIWRTTKDMSREWTDDEMHYLEMQWATSLSNTAISFIAVQSESSQPYYDQLSLLMNNHERLIETLMIDGIKRRIDFLIGKELFGALVLASDAVSIPRPAEAAASIGRLVLSYAASVYPRYSEEVLSSFVVCLNNLASMTDKFEYAQEAMELSSGRPTTGIRERYIRCYSAWQYARLTQASDFVVRLDRAKLAYLAGLDLLRDAVDAGEGLDVRLTERLLEILEQEFPELRNLPIEPAASRPTDLRL